MYSEIQQNENKKFQIKKRLVNLQRDERFY